MRGLGWPLSAVLLLWGCDSKPPAAYGDDAADPAGVSDVVADAAAPTAQDKQHGPLLLNPPDSRAKRAGIDMALRTIWRDTPYQIASINYGDEKVSALGNVGTEFKASIAVNLAFPSGWNAECIGQIVAYGCQYLDANVMQMKPIAAGESRTYNGTLNMTHLNGEWHSNVRWEQRIR
jgi:hypothetical protein